MCKTLYDLFTSEPNEQELYHSIATVATLMLQIGEVGKRFFRGTTPASRHAIAGYARGDTPSIEEDTLQSAVDASTHAGSSDDVSVNDLQGRDSGCLMDGESCAYFPSRPEGDGASAAIRPTSIVDYADAAATPSDSLLASSTTTVASNATGDNEWSISFEQFLASMLTEPPLVVFFEAFTDLTPAIERYRNRRLQRQPSSRGVSVSDV